MSRSRERRRGRRPLVTAARWAGTAVRWRVHLVLPGVAGAAVMAVSLGEVAGHIWGRGLAPWVGGTVAGVFLLLFGAELNRQPPEPPE